MRHTGNDGNARGFVLLGVLLAIAILVLMYYGASTGFFVRSSSQSEVSNSQSKDSKPMISEEALIERIQKVVESGGNIDASQNNDKQTLLHIAAKSGNVDAINLCLDNGANMEVYDDPDIMTPLHRALLGGHLQAAKVLIERGANLESRGVRGKTTLYSAILSETNRENLVKLLLASGASVKVRDTNGDTPLLRSISSCDPNVVELLIEHGASVKTSGDLRVTPLHIAAFYGQQEIVKLLIEHGADIDARDAHRLTPLDYAFMQPYTGTSMDDKERVVKILRSHSAIRGSEH